jgi:hypothetical protein
LNLAFDPRTDGSANLCAFQAQSVGLMDRRDIFK